MNLLITSYILSSLYSDLSDVNNRFMGLYDHTLRFGCIAKYMMIPLITKKAQRNSFSLIYGSPPARWYSTSASVTVDNLWLSAILISAGASTLVIALYFVWIRGTLLPPDFCDTKSFFSDLSRTDLSLGSYYSVRMIWG